MVDEAPDPGESTEMPGIVRSEQVHAGDPRIEGTRVTVPRIQGLVEEAGKSPEEVAETLRVSLADVYRALAYYHDHPGEMAEIEERKQELVRETLESGDATTVEGIIDEHDR